MKTKVNLLLVASGTGSDANAIMRAAAINRLPDVEIKGLVSTREGAGCLEKARVFKIPEIILDCQKISRSEFEQGFRNICGRLEIDLIFLVGCVVKIPMVEGVKIYNIHPADLEIAGGRGMYGLEPHKRVLENILDLISRGRKNIGDNFYTFPTIHEVGEKYDEGVALLKAGIEIPASIISSLVNIPTAEVPEELAEELQKYVLEYEHIMLPQAVEMAARKLLEINRQKFLAEKFPPRGGNNFSEHYF